MKASSLTPLTKFLRCAALVAFLALSPQNAQASPAESLKESAALLHAGKPDEAIRLLESAADAGENHPDLSFNRGLAYLRRSDTAQGSPRDLGQAAAGFAEAAQLRPDDKAARLALTQVQQKLASKHSQKDTRTEDLSLGLGEQFLLSLSPFLLTLFAALGSVTLSIGFLLRLSQKESRVVAGNITALLGALVLSLAFVLSLARSSLFTDSRVAVVVSKSAPVVNEAGQRVKGAPPLRQGTVVYLGPPTFGAAPLTSLSGRTHVLVSDVRYLTPPKESFWPVL